MYRGGPGIPGLSPAGIGVGLIVAGSHVQTPDLPPAAEGQQLYLG
jgi:hypothetical protein